jgi:hypothetical protein
MAIVEYQKAKAIGPTRRLDAGHALINDCCNMFTKLVPCGIFRLISRLIWKHFSSVVKHFLSDVATS